jgi:predicted molibdopterin-dependent oxidoreductase YjgC
MIVNQIAKLMGVDFGYQGQLKNIFKEIAEKVPGYSGLSHNLLANEGAVHITLPPPVGSQIDAADLKKRLDDEVFRINRNVTVDTSEMTTKAGARLQKRYPMITRYSEILPQAPLQEGKTEPVVFPT